MNIDKFNSEGYYDPTPYEAITAIEMKNELSEHLDLLCISALLMPGMWKKT